MIWYQVIEIRNEEPLKIGAGGNKAHWDEPCKDYVPGSTLRGGAIARMRRMGLFDDASKSILQQLECFNGYLYRDGHLYTPAPNHLRMDKHEYRRQKTSSYQSGVPASVPLFDLSAGNLEHKNPIPEPYVTIKDHQLEGARPDKSYRLHHSSLLNPELKERANLFNYQALESGQLFRSIIAYSDDIKQRVEKMWKGTNIWYLGGSKGSGYGRCTVDCLGEPVADYSLARLRLGIPDPVYNLGHGGPESTPMLTLTCLSDVAVRGNYGQPQPFLSASWLQESCGVAIKSDGGGNRHYIQTGLTEGYNATWQARYPKETTIKAGSILKYELKEQLDEAAFQKLAERLEGIRYGARNQDGYGWIAVNIPYSSILRLNAKRSTKENEERQPNTREEQREPSHVEQSILIISKGLQDKRQRWLRILNAKLKESSLPTEKLMLQDLKSHHCQMMMEQLEVWLRENERGGDNQKQQSSVQFKPSYFNDRDRCSLAGVNFAGIIKYLWSTQSTSEYANLEEFAHNKLGSKHGKVYYSGDSSRIRKRLVAELMVEALYMQHRVGEEEGAVR